MSHPDLVPFRLVYWRSKRSPVMRRASQQVFARGPALLTMCGSSVSYSGRTSTLTLLVSVDSELYGLTVDHLFKKHTTESQPRLPEDLNTPSEEDGQRTDEVDMNLLNILWTDDVIYHDIDDRDEASDKTNTESEYDLKSKGVTIGQHSWTVSGTKIVLVPNSDPSYASRPYLDWALIRFDHGYYKRPNAFYFQDDSSPQFLATDYHFVYQPGIGKAYEEVFMVSGATGTRAGILLPGYSYIGGDAGQDLCKVWSMELSDDIGNLCFAYFHSTG